MNRGEGTQQFRNLLEGQNGAGIAPAGGGVRVAFHEDGGDARGDGGPSQERDSLASAAGGAAQTPDEATGANIRAALRPSAVKRRNRIMAAAYRTFPLSKRRRDSMKHLTRRGNNWSSATNYAAP